MRRAGRILRHWNPVKSSSMIISTTSSRKQITSVLAWFQSYKLFEWHYCGDKGLHGSMEIIKSKHDVWINARVALVDTWNASLQELQAMLLQIITCKSGRWAYVLLQALWLKRSSYGKRIGHDYLSTKYLPIILLWRIVPRQWSTDPLLKLSRSIMFNRINWLDQTMMGHNLSNRN